MYQSTYNYLYVHLPICTLTYMYTYLHVHLPTCTLTYMYTNLHVHLPTFMYITYFVTESSFTAFECYFNESY